MASKDISVIITVYNGFDTFSECIESVCSQLDERAECIVVDDGSDEAFIALVREYQSANPDFTLLLRNHAGVSAARNAGMAAAKGEYLIFLDGDDALQEGFLHQALSLAEGGSDLYVFGIERAVREEGGSRSEYWTVPNRVFASAGAFADEYVVNRHLLIYSQSNKLYKKSLIDQHRIRFDESCSFGEDRLFNYEYLAQCKEIRTVDSLMLRYIKRPGESLSARHIPDYFNKVLALHRRKMDCMLGLSEHTSAREREDFACYDLAKEIRVCLDRFADHPEEETENIGVINDLVFVEPVRLEEPPQAIVVLGSFRCEYRIRHALEIGRGNPDTLYVLSGGNPSAYMECTEAEYMRDYLLREGIPPEKILIDCTSKGTRANVLNCVELLEEAQRQNVRPFATIGIVTGAFHMRRVCRMLAASKPAEWNILPLSAFGPNTAPHNWYKNETGIAAVMCELEKSYALWEEGSARF